MITEYILFFLILPSAIMWKMKFSDRSDEKQLLNKEDTIALRGISAFFVISAHYMTWVDEMIGYTTSPIVKGVISQLGGLGVLIFFFVSGYGLYESYGNSKVDKSYIVKRLKGVYFPYILIKLIFFASFHIMGISNGSVVSELVNILLIEDWFVQVIVIQYVVFYVAAKINQKYMISISIVADALLTVLYIYQHKPIGWFNALWLFTFGIFASKYQERIIKLITSFYYSMFAASFIGFIVTGCIFAVNKGLVWANAIKPVSGMFLCMCICIIMRKCKLNSPINMWGGYRSLHLYIVHISIWQLVKIENPISRLWTVLLLTILVTEILFRLITCISNIVLRDK